MKRLTTLAFGGMCLALAGWALTGCDSRPQVIIEGASKPTFRLSGRGGVQVLSVDGSHSMKPYWQIAPKEGFDMTTPGSLGSLIYGEVPKGFRQVYPEDGSTPPALPEKEFITFALRCADGSALGVRFIIYDGKAVVERS